MRQARGGRWTTLILRPLPGTRPAARPVLKTGEPRGSVSSNLTPSAKLQDFLGLTRSGAKLREAGSTKSNCLQDGELTRQRSSRLANYLSESALMSLLGLLDRMTHQALV